MDAKSFDIFYQDFCWKRLEYLWSILDDNPDTKPLVQKKIDEIKNCMYKWWLIEVDEPKKMEPKYRQGELF